MACSDLYTFVCTLVIAAGPRGHKRPDGTIASLTSLLQEGAVDSGVLAEETRELAVEEERLSFMAARRTALIDRYLELRASSSPGDAEAFASGLITPSRTK